MGGVWRRIEAWLQVHALDMLGSLRFGATADKITRTEAVLRVRFPADVRASFRLHNGQQAAVDEPLRLVLGLIDGWELLSLEKMCQQWAIL